MTHDPPSLTIVGLLGSLRKKSINAGLMRAARELAPAGVAIEVFDIAPIPFYNEDVREAGEPAVVAELKERVRAADAVLIASPEYNHGLPGMLKNAIDWLSRPPDTSPLRHKAFGLMGATGGQYGTARGQLNARVVLASTASYVMPDPVIALGGARGKFDSDGNLTDEPTRAAVAAYVAALADWSRLTRR